jgi:hypothetical protein
VRAAVNDVHHGDRQSIGTYAAQVAVEGGALRHRSRAGGGHGDGQRDAGVGSYSQVANGLEYLAGYYYADKQLFRLVDGMRTFRLMGDMLVMLCSHSIIGIPLNVFSTFKVDSIAFEVTILQAQQDLCLEVGCYDYGSVQMITKTRAIFRGNDQSYRMIQNTGSGVTVSDNLAKDRQQKLLNKLVGLTASGYDRFNGYLFWGSNIKQ